MTDRKQTNYNKLIAKTHDGSLVFLDYIFEDGDFKGATGTVFDPISKSEYEERTSVENLTETLEDMWRMAVANNQTSEGLNEWVETAMHVDGAEELAFDTSYMNNEMWDQMRAKGYGEEDYPFFECSGGGRCFNAKNDFAEVYEPELLKLAEEMEAKA